MKTKEELDALKEEVKALEKKLAELTKEELSQVTGGKILPGRESPSAFGVPTDDTLYERHIYPPETEESARKKFLGGQ